MKRFRLIVLIVCLCIAASGCSSPVIYVRDDPDVKWGESPISSEEPSEAPTPEPTGIVPLPSNEPVAVIESVTNMTLTLSFTFGERAGTYTGEMVNGLPEGNGTFTSTNNEGSQWTYTGQWAAGHMNGIGTTEWNDGYTLSGDYKDDRLNGQGRESWYGKIQYEGSYRDSSYHGQGTYYNNSGQIVYTGTFANGLIQESAAARSGRVGAFKDSSVPLDIGDIYGSCQEEISMHVELTGEIFDMRFYPSDTDRDFCDILLYEQGQRDTEHIVCVFYLLSEGEAPPSDGQTVTIWGTTEYLYTYTTVDGDELTVPLLEAWSIE